MNTTQHNRPTAYPPVPKRRWFQTGTFSFYLLCLVLLVIARATYWLVVKEYQTRQLYTLAEQLGFNDDSQVLKDRDWYCTEWSPIGQQNCRVFLAYTTTLNASQMKMLAEKFKIQSENNHSMTPSYVLSHMRTFLPDLSYSTHNNTTANNEFTILIWTLNNDSALRDDLTLQFYQISQLKPPFLHAWTPINANIVVLYGKAKGTWLF